MCILFDTSLGRIPMYVYAFCRLQPLWTEIRVLETGESPTPGAKSHRLDYSRVQWIQWCVLCLCCNKEAHCAWRQHLFHFHTLFSMPLSRSPVRIPMGSGPCGSFDGESYVFVLGPHMLFFQECRNRDPQGGSLIYRIFLTGRICSGVVLLVYFYICYFIFIWAIHFNHWL